MNEADLGLLHRRLSKRGRLIKIGGLTGMRLRAKLKREQWDMQFCKLFLLKKIQFILCKVI